jgi:hypothetical protein
LFEEKAVIVTDGEPAFVLSIKKAFPNMEMLRCWNHMIKDIELWLKRHGGLKHDSAFYKNEIRDLFKSTSLDVYTVRMEKAKKSWDIAFDEYFTECIHPHSNKYGRWTLEKYNLYSLYSGLTTNTSEGI